MSFEISPEDLYWLAGYLEGEGSFLKGSPSSPNQPRVVVQTTDEDIARKVALLLKVTVSFPKKRKEHWKQNHLVSLKGNRAIQLMFLLKPLMGIRRQKQIQVAIDSYSFSTKGSHRRKLTTKQVLDIRKMINENVSISSISSIYNVSWNTIKRLSIGLSYKEI